MAHVQKPDFVFRRNGRVQLNWRGRQFSRLLAAEVCASAVVMLDTPCSEVVWRVLATHSIRQFPLHFPSLPHRVSSHFKWTLPKVKKRSSGGKRGLLASLLTYFWTKYCAKVKKNVTFLNCHSTKVYGGFGYSSHHSQPRNYMVLNVSITARPLFFRVGCPIPTG